MYFQTGETGFGRTHGFAATRPALAVNAFALLYLVDGLNRVKMRSMRKQRNWITISIIATASVAWVLANGLDMLSMLFVVQSGGQLALVGQLMLRHPTEFFLLYMGMRTLSTLAIYLLVTFGHKHWPSVAHVFWNALTACALVTAVAAWWRVY